MDVCWDFSVLFFVIQFEVQVWTLTEWCCLTGWHIYPVLTWSVKSFFKAKAFPAACFIHTLLISQYSPAGYKDQFFYTQHCAALVTRHTFKSEIKLKRFDCCPVLSAHRHITLLHKHSHADLIKKNKIVCKILFNQFDWCHIYRTACGHCWWSRTGISYI